MLIKIFGIWLMANSINYLEKDGDKNCSIEYGPRRYVDLPYSCDEVAAEINKQIKASKE